MSLSPPKSDAPRGGVRSAWGGRGDQPTVEPVGAPPALLLPAQLVVDPDSLVEVVAQVRAAIAEAVREGVAEGFATAWPENQPTPVPPGVPAAG